MTSSAPFQLRRVTGTAASGLRLFISFALAGGLMLLLFWLMSALIAPRKQPNALAVIPRIDFARLKRDTELHEIKRVKPQIEKPEPPPTAPTVSASQSAGGGLGVDVASLAPASVDFGGIIGTGESGAVGGLAATMALGSGSDRDAVPEVRINPDYPPDARMQGIQGWVTVSFDVGADGSTRNIRVVAAKPAGVFEQATKRAVAGWKYSPKIEDGKRVERKGLQVRLKFSLRS